jgi:PadR family transcriptional regulator AphA
MTNSRRPGQAGSSTTAHALLGLLSLRRWSTYELAKQVQRSLNWMWPRAERKLYEEPKRLVAAGLAASRREHTGSRPRTVYEITESGREALRQWMDAPSTPRSQESEAMLKVFFADAGSLAQLENTLTCIETEARSRLERLTDMAEQGLAGRSPFPERLHLSTIGLAMQFGQEKAMLEWSRWAREQVGTWKGSADPGDWDHAAVMRRILDDARAADAGPASRAPRTGTR